MRLLSLFDTLDTSLHTQQVSNKLSAAIYFTSVWYKQFQIWTRNGSLCILDCERCVHKPPNRFWKVYNLSTGAASFFAVPKNCFRILVWVNQMQSGHVVVSPLISLLFFAHSLQSNVPTRLNSNFKILLYSFQLLPTTVMFQKFPITFWFTDKMSFFCR